MVSVHQLQHLLRVQHEQATGRSERSEWSGRASVLPNDGAKRSCSHFNSYFSVVIFSTELQTKRQRWPEGATWMMERSERMKRSEWSGRPKQSRAMFCVSIITVFKKYSNRFAQWVLLHICRCSLAELTFNSNNTDIWLDHWWYSTLTVTN